MVDCSSYIHPKDDMWVDLDWDCFHGMWYGAMYVYQEHADNYFYRSKQAIFSWQDMPALRVLISKGMRLRSEDNWVAEVHPTDERFPLGTYRVMRSPTPHEQNWGVYQTFKRFSGMHYLDKDVVAKRADMHAQALENGLQPTPDILMNERESKAYRTQMLRDMAHVCTAHIHKTGLDWRAARKEAYSWLPDWIRSRWYAHAIRNYPWDRENIQRDWAWSAVITHSMIWQYRVASAASTWEDFTVLYGLGISEDVGFSQFHGYMAGLANKGFLWHGDGFYRRLGNELEKLETGQEDE